MSERTLLLSDPGEPALSTLLDCDLIDVERAAPPNALSRVSKELPGLIVLNSASDDCSALEMILELESLGQRPPILVLGSLDLDPERADRSRLKIHLGTDPPCRQDIEIALSRAGEDLESSSRLPLRVYDYLLLANLLGCSAVFRFLTKGLNREAEVILVGGECWNVFFDGGSGQESLKRVLDLEVNFLTQSPLTRIPSSREIRTTTRLALAALGHKDGPKPERADSGDGFAAALERGMAAALMRDYPKAEREFLEALTFRPEDPRALFNLQRIQKRLRR